MKAIMIIFLLFIIVGLASDYMIINQIAFVLLFVWGFIMVIISNDREKSIKIEKSINNNNK